MYVVDFGFFDICGGPGSWSQYIFSVTSSSSNQKVTGFGCSLGNEEHAAKKSCVWYNELVERDDFSGWMQTKFIRGARKAVERGQKQGSAPLDSALTTKGAARSICFCFLSFRVFF